MITKMQLAILRCDDSFQLATISVEDVFHIYLLLMSPNPLVQMVYLLTIFDLGTLVEQHEKSSTCH